MTHALYDILLHLSLVTLLPYFLVKMISSGKYRRGLAERLGFFRSAKFEGFGGSRVVWFHAVSVGEARAVMPMLRVFRERHPEVKIVFSTVTATGNDIAKKEGALLIDALIYFPLDLSWVVKRTVRRIRPDMLIIVEKELWPNVMRVLKNASVPVVFVNGTVSERSFLRYNRFSFFFREVFSGIGFFCGRTKEDAQRAVALGTNPAATVVTGNIKFDMRPPTPGAGELEALRTVMGIEPADMVIVAGSTHAGEEKILLDAFKRLKGEWSVTPLKLVLAPRHPERFNEVETLVRASGLTCSRRSKGAADSPRRDVAILDTIGELGIVYSLSTVAFVGGTLVPVGGHNLLEPAFFGKPVLHGPYTKNCLQMAELLERHGASMRVGEKDLFDCLGKLLRDSGLMEKMGIAAKGVVDSNRGATERTLAVIDGIMKKTMRGKKPRPSAGEAGW
ncbi:MAG: 3-deoxy-D-manno-octulosonic acid transferase [Deltaproteobacteria bacterium]|nr:3-deoxy-D-manno-octulosonic acid transferase [Deltaproteobacteria bacterium]